MSGTWNYMVAFAEMHVSMFTFDILAGRTSASRETLGTGRLPSVLPMNREIEQTSGHGSNKSIAQQRRRE